MTKDRAKRINHLAPRFSALLTSSTCLLLALNPAQAEIEGHRYVWGELPFTFVTPERVIEGKTTCVSNNYGSGSQQQNNYYGQNNSSTSNWKRHQNNYNNYNNPQNQASSTITTCTTTPARVIPSSSTTRLLQVQYDCTEQTYDAKGDGKAWRTMRAGYGDGVYGQFRRLCQRNGGYDQPF